MKILNRGYIFLFPLFFFLILGLLSGCASISQIRGQEGAEEIVKKEPIQIERIDLEKGAGIDRLSIVSSKPIIYTAFKLTSPSRLVIDIPDAILDVGMPTVVRDGIIRDVTPQFYQEKSGNIGRIEIGLEEDVEYKLDLKGNILLVEVRKMPVGKEEQMVARGSPLSEAEVQAEEGLKASKELEKTLKEAGNILSMDVIKKDTYNLVTLKGDGRIGNYNAFTLEGPRRFVLDIWGIKSLLKEREIRVSSPFIRTIRIGEHEENLRFVFDVEGEEFPPYSVEKIGDMIYIIMGDVKTAKAVLPEIGRIEEVKKVEAVKEIAETRKVEKVEPLVKVESVDFKEADKASVVVVKTSTPAEYNLSKSPDGKTIALIVKDALIPQDLQRTLDTSELKTAIESISSYPSSKEPKAVTVLVRLKEEILPRIERKENVILMEFPKKAPEKVAAIETPERFEASPPVKVERAKEVEEVKKEQGIAREGVKPLKKEEVKKEPISEKAPQEKRYVGRRISLDVKDADIKNIFRLIAEVSRLNVVVAEEVTGKITLRLIDVPWDQALDIILKTKGLGMIREGNIMRIAPVEKIRQEEEAVLAQKKAKEKLEDLTVKLVPVNYAKASDLSAKVKDLLSERGGVTVDERTNTLVIKDIQANIDEAIAMVKRLDTPTPQVLIEARIVEASSTFARDLGVQWGMDVGFKGGGDNQMAIFGSGDTAGLTAATNLGLSSSLGTSNFALSLPASGTAGTLGALGFTFGKLTGDPLLLDLKLTAGEVSGLSKTISRPKIVTLDNKEAKISQGTTIPYQTTSQSGTQTQFVDATLNLTVTPHVTPDGRISLKIQASKNSIGETTQAGPTINKKEASTEVLLKDMETVVIGGIVETQKSDSTSGIPWVKDVPVLGWLFKNKSKLDKQTELLIFITPKIIKEKPVEG